MEKPQAGNDAAKKKNNGLALIFGLIGIAAVAAIIWLLFIDDSDDSTSASGGAAEIVSVDTLQDTAEEQETPIYWAGERVDTELELSQPDEERAYVRYLTDGAEAGDPQPDFLTVGTYANPDAVAELRKRGNEPGGVLAEAPGGATVYFSRTRPESVYLAYPGDDVEIEVYDPDFKQALQLVNSGQIVAAE